MTTPTPPPGYKLVKGVDIKDRVPEGALCWMSESGNFKASIRIGKNLTYGTDLRNFYAIPESTPVQDVETMEQSITDEAKTAVDDPYQIHIGGVKCDPYRIARAYSINDPVIFQALKKLLRCGRKHKDRATDVREAITSLERWEQMNQEDSK